MTIHNLFDGAQDYFEHMVGKTIEEVGIFDGELVIFLDDLSEVCIFEDVDGLAMQINERPELDG
jgi:hypothetical protein